MKLAVVAVLLIFIKILYFEYFPTHKISNTPVKYTITNNTRNIIKQVLSDKSTVCLDPHAKIEFPQKFKNNSRNIMMEGECFFEVTKNRQRPFIIQSKHLITKVWGTSFKVSDNVNAATAQVTVVTGKVSVSKSGSNATSLDTKLTQNEVVLLPKPEVCNPS